jgi:predicted PurR-regulated permease PerM
MGALAGPLGIVLATPLAAVAIVIVKRLYVEDTLGDHAVREAPG